MIFYKLLVFMRSLTKRNLPNMNHLDENSPSNNKLLWGEKTSLSLISKMLGVGGKKEV